MKWVFAFTIVIAAGIMGYFYVQLMNEKISTPVAVSTATTSRTVTLIHAFKDGEHRFSGQIKLPHSCFALDAEAVHDKKNSSIVTITLNAKDKMLDQTLCANIPTNYPFQILAEGPEDIVILASFNGDDLGTKIIETEWQSSTGTYFNK